MFSKTFQTVSEPITPVFRAWFVTDRKIEERSPISFKIFAENKMKVAVNSFYEMGESNIAPYPLTNLYYIDFLMGPLCGEAIKAEAIDSKVFNRGHLWTS